jgi:hypothetical protein
MLLSHLLFLACDPGAAREAEPSEAWPEWEDPSAEENEDPSGDPPDADGSDAATNPDGTNPDADICEPEGCIDLAEAVDRGWASIEYGRYGLNISNSGAYPICFDGWYSFLSSTSQDAAGGIIGESEIEAESAVTLQYADWGDGEEAWWCMEHNQLTATGADYTFNGARAPEAVALWAEFESDEDADGVEDHRDVDQRYHQTQLNVWEWIDTRPVFIVGRQTNWFSVSVGSAVPVVVEVTNLGREAGAAQVVETLPAGWTPGAFDPAPRSVTVTGDGSTRIEWAVSLDGAIEPDDNTAPTEYDSADLRYTLTFEADCSGRSFGLAPTAAWRDGSGDTLQGEGSPLVLQCCDAPEEQGEDDPYNEGGGLTNGPR